jgi:hypothetical protein
MFEECAVDIEPAIRCQDEPRGFKSIACVLPPLAAKKELENLRSVSLTKRRSLPSALYRAVMHFTGLRAYGIASVRLLPCSDS